MSDAIFIAATELREAQKAYMLDRGNEALGKAVGQAAIKMDVALAQYSDWSERAAICAEELLHNELRDVPANQDDEGIGHIVWMCMKLAARAVGSPTKACRWLGYVQGALVTMGRTSLEREKRRNLESAGPDLDTPPWPE